MDVGKACNQCTNCPFGGGKVGWKGRFDARFVVVGESPGKTEVRKGYPFAGPSGQILHTFLEEDNILITNAIECYPRNKKPEKLAAATSECHPRLLEVVRAHPRKIILTLGNEAVRSLTGNYSLKITQIRGQIIQSDLAEIGILPAIHPAALLRGTGSYRQFREDLLYAKHLAEGGNLKEYIRPIWKTLKDEHEVQKALDMLSMYDEYAADIETSGLSARDNYILNLGVEAPGCTVYDKESGEEKRIVFIFNPEHLHMVAPALEDTTKDWCWHSGKFDVQFLREIGIWAHVDSDTMLLNYALDESPGVHDLETVGGDVLGAPNYKDMLKPYLPNKKTSYAVIPRPVLDEYLSVDVHTTCELKPILRERVAKDPVIERLYTQTLLPASELLADVESRGMYIHQDILRANEEEYSKKLHELRHKLCTIAKVEHNPNSPQQVADLLYRKMKLPKRGGGGTAKEILEKLPQTPYVKILLAYRRVAKVYGTYVGTAYDPKTKGPKGLYKHIESDGRVHPSFLIHGTPTGRLSCRDPNLQNIPRERQLRAQFGAPPGRALLEIDYSQAELRSLAFCSGDPDLIYIYTHGLDLHTELAKFLFPGWENRKKSPDVRLQAQAKEERVMAKTVNFGIVYGRTAFTIADAFNITFQEAQRLIDGWFERFPIAHQFINRCRNAPSSGRVMTTLFGRRKRVGVVSGGNLRDLMNEAANFPHQSIASDLTLHSAIKVRPKLYVYDSFIVNLVHDSIVIETPDDPIIMKEVARMAVITMEETAPEWGITRVPFQADAEYGYTWGNTTEYTRDELSLALVA